MDSHGTYLLFRDLTFVLPHLNRTTLSERTGINYQTINSKLYRFRNGQEVGFTKEQSEKLRDYLFEVMEKLELILVKPEEVTNETTN